MTLSALNISGRRKLPVIIAAEAAECGLACMAMIANYHGHEIDLNGMRQRFSLSLTGATLRSLMGFADALDLSPRPLRVELSHLGTKYSARPSCTGTSITSSCLRRRAAAASPFTIPLSA